ncbi:MAG: hypothetical protein ACOYIP_08435 [Coriobacteriales bacterium]
MAIAVPEAKHRIRTKGVECTICGESIPRGSYITLDNGISFSGPELLFLELAGSMHPLEHLMLGHELCGSFSRDPLDPYNGPVTYGVRPVTNAGRIRDFLSRTRFARCIDEAWANASILDDNAWSPTESLIAALLRLPMDSFGFEFGELELNPRVEKAVELPGARGSRVPDIMFKDSSVGINYDGLLHFDLDSIAKAGIELGANPNSTEGEASLGLAISGVRAKLVDDIRRNRELATSGLTVFPVLKEDLYVKGGFEQLVQVIVEALEQVDNRDCSLQRIILSRERLREERRQMILSLLPGTHVGDVRPGRFIGGYPVATGKCEIIEYWFEL